MALRDVDETDLGRLPQLDEREVKLLYHLSWWDGPLTGVIDYQGQRCWFQFAGEDDGRHYRHVVYPLSEEHLRQLEDYQARRAAWAEENMPWEGDEDHQAARRAWVDAGLDWTGPDLTGATPLGWFMDGVNQAFYGIEVEYGPIQEKTEGAKENP